MLVFTDEAWRLCGAKAVAINDRLSYILVKQGAEYLILAKKRLGEFISRFTNARDPKTTFKTLMVFSGAELSDMVLERPFGESGSLPVIVNRELKLTFGTGIHSVSPAHGVDDLKMSYAYDLSRSGCIDAETGFLTSPKVLAGSDIADEEGTLAKIRTLLKDEGQFYGSFPH